MFKWKPEYEVGIWFLVVAVAGAILLVMTQFQPQILDLDQNQTQIQTKPQSLYTIENETLIQLTQCQTQILFVYTTGCPACERTMPIIKTLEQEKGYS